MKKIILLASLAFSINAFAQVPSYVPTNGLQGWWQFSGNANDGSTNGYNGTVNGATLATDRFGNTNSSYNFNGTNNDISLPIGFTTGSASKSFSVWFYLTNGTYNFVLDGGTSVNGKSFGLFWNTNPTINKLTFHGDGATYDYEFADINFNQWYHTVITYDGTTVKSYLNGVYIGSKNATLNTSTTSNIKVGCRNNTSAYFLGKIDDIGVWNSTLTQQEITDLYNATNCSNNSAITPQINSLTTGSTAAFTANTSDPNPSFVWQSDFGQGFQTLNNFGYYSGANTATLNISNLQLPNHNQPIRVITTSGNCIDTSNVAVINILDTCITNVTVYDTLLTTVTDTLVINAQITGINPPNNLNTLKVFPNPASTHITIDYGNFNAMSGYTLTIVNSTSQTVFTTPINQQTSYIDLSTWTGTGIYFVQLIDPQNNTIENRKIVIQ